MKCRIVTILIALMVLISLPQAVLAEEVLPVDETETVAAEETKSPINLDLSEEVYPGGSKIHIIKVFDEQCGSDALLLESEGHFAMVDVGLPYDYDYYGACDTENSVVNYLHSYGVTELDYIILTHMHVDHVGNMENVLRSFPVGAVYARKFDYPDKFVYFVNNRHIDDICSEYNVPAEIMYDQDTFELGDLTIKIFNLDDEFCSSNDAGGDNNNSAGILVTDSYGHKAFLAGDMNNYDGDEDRLVELHSDELSGLDYLKVGHHGYSGSSTYNFVKMANPLYVTVTGWEISGKKDPYGNGKTVFENFKTTRAGKAKSFYYMNHSENGIIFTMGENLSINNTFVSPTRTGKANNTLSIYYNVNGGALKSEAEDKYSVNGSGNICSTIKDIHLEDNKVLKQAEAGDIAPMYYYDMDRELEDSESLGLSRRGHTFAGWYNADDKSQVFEAETSYNASDIDPNIDADSSDITLAARWQANRYKVLFFANGGTGSMNSLTCMYNKQGRLIRNRFKRDQYFFTGWNTMPDGSGQTFCDMSVIKNLTAENNKTISLYAQWEKIGVGSPHSIKTMQSE